MQKSFKEMSLIIRPSKVKGKFLNEWDWMGSSTMQRQNSDHCRSMLAVDRRGKSYRLQVSMMTVDRSGKNYRWWLLKWQPLDEDDFCTFFLTIITTSTISCKQKGGKSCMGKESQGLICNPDPLIVCAKVLQAYWGQVGHHIWCLPCLTQHGSF